MNEFHAGILANNNEVNIVTYRLTARTMCAPLININTLISKIRKDKPNSNITIITDNELIFKFLDRETMQKFRINNENIIVEDIFTLKKYGLDLIHTHNFYFLKGKLVSLEIYLSNDDI